MTDVLGYLQDKGLELKRSDASNVHTACFFCDEDPSKRGRMYVNIDADAEIPGLFKCFLCGTHGSLVSIKKHFGDPINEQEEHGDELSQIFRAAATYYHEQLGENPMAFSWLRSRERNLSVETIVDARIGYATGGLYRRLKDEGFSTQDIVASGLVIEERASKRLVDSLNGMVTIPYFVAGNCVGVRGRSYPYDKTSNSPKYKTCGGTKAKLFNSDAVWQGDEIVICEGEFDALSLRQLGIAAVAVPGANVWQDAWDGYFIDMRRIWLAFDPDEAGEKGAKKLLDKFGPRVKSIRLEHDGSPVDVTDWVAAGGTAQDFEEAKSDALAGGLLVTVDDALAEHAETQGVQGIKFGTDELDRWLAPGLLPSQVMVILAKSGTGKTIFLLNTMQWMRMVPGQQDMKFLFVSLEQTRGEWFERARRIHRFYNVSAGDSDALDFWRNNLMIIDKNRLTETELVAALDDYEYRMGGPPDVVLVDYLGYWAQSFKGERYERTADAVMTLKAIAKDRRVPIITPHQVSRIAKYGEEPDVDAARDAGVIEETADFLFLLWTQDAALGRSEEEKSGVVHMRIGKSRHGGRGVKIDHQFAPLSLTLIPHLNTTDVKLLQRARDELKYEREYQDKWEQAVYRHRTGFQGHLEPMPGFQERMIP